jgi:cation:H+ antiporter
MVWHTFFDHNGDAAPMDVVLAVVAMVVSIALLDKGADWLVDGATSLAMLARVTPMLIGLTVVAIGTSLPELGVSTVASIEGDAGISLGNVVGSNIANILLVLGMAATLNPIRMGDQPITKESGLIILSALLLMALAVGGGVGRLDGVVLLVAFGVILVYLVQDAKRRAPDVGVELHGHKAPTSLALTIGGLAAVLVGSLVLVRSAVAIAEALSIPSVIIGLTVVAVGTSIPELATSVKAAAKRTSDIAVGNVVGSNISNTLLIVGVAAAILPIPVDGSLWKDLGIMLGVSLLLLPLLKKGAIITRRMGVLMLASYVVYMAYLAMTGGAR